MQTEKKDSDYFNQFIQYKALAFKFGDSDRVVDLILDEDTEQAEKLPVKNVCAKMHVDLCKRLDDTVSLLQISKRKFIEMAIIDALDKADSILEETGVSDYLEELAERQSKGGS